jgi:hypothetical protein
LDARRAASELRHVCACNVGTAALPAVGGRRGHMSSGAWAMVVATASTVGALRFLIGSLRRSIRNERSPQRGIWRKFALGRSLMMLLSATWARRGLPGGRPTPTSNASTASRSRPVTSSLSLTRQPWRTGRHGEFNDWSAAANPMKRDGDAFTHRFRSYPAGPIGSASSWTANGGRTTGPRTRSHQRVRRGRHQSSSSLTPLHRTARHPLPRRMANPSPSGFASPQQADNRNDRQRPATGAGRRGSHWRTNA